MQTIPAFTIKDLVKIPEAGYVEFNGDRLLCKSFETISPDMMELEEGGKFRYEREIYEVKSSIPKGGNRPENVQLNCLKL